MAVVIVATAFVLNSIKIVPQHCVGIVERLGRHRRTASPGLILVVPFVDTVRLFRLDDRDVTGRAVGLRCSDGQLAAADYSVTVKVHDPVTVVYEVADVEAAVAEVVETTLRRALLDLRLDDALASHGMVHRQVDDALTEQSNRLGVQPVRVDVGLAAA